MKQPLTRLFLLLLVAIQGGVSQGASWSYSGPTGPANWGNLAGAQACHGRSQSPININTYETGQKSFPPFTLTGYNLPAVKPGATQPRLTSMVNNGHVLQGNMEGDYLLRGGGLKGTYKAVQFQMHWGSTNTKGSEHNKNSKAYPAEIHFIHYDSTTYQTLGLAATKPNGLAILGFWIRVGPKNLAWDPIINNLRAVKYANHPFIFTVPLAISSLLPADLTKFYRYSGSLTTPGCEESVIWTMFDREIVLSRAQLSKFRQLSRFETPPYGPGAGPALQRPLVDNYRPIQRLWFRTVYQSWPHNDYEYYGGGTGDAVVPGWTPKFNPGIAAGAAGGIAPAGGAGPALVPPAGAVPKAPGGVPKQPPPAQLRFTGDSIYAPAALETFTGDSIYAPAALENEAGFTGDSIYAPAALETGGGAGFTGDSIYAPAALETEAGFTGDSIYAPAELETGGYGAYNGYGVGMERLWQALRNGQFGGAHVDFEYYGDHYGNNNVPKTEADYYEYEGHDHELDAVQGDIHPKKTVFG